MIKIKEIDLDSFEVSEPAIQVLFGALSIQNSSNIHNQPLFINSFTSELSISDSEIHNVSIEKALIEATGSSLRLENINISNIENTNNVDFIQVAFDGELIAKNIIFKNSDSSLFSLVNSQAEISDVNFNNIKNGDVFSKFLR